MVVWRPLVWRTVNLHTGTMGVHRACFPRSAQQSHPPRPGTLPNDPFLSCASSLSSRTNWRALGKKTDQGGGPLRLTPVEQQVPRGQQYAVGVVQRFVSFVLDGGASLRCAAGVLGLLGGATDPEESTPHWTTGRLWLLRIGLAALRRPKEIADDWAWMVDHSIQIGQCKCLVILGIRLSELPDGRPLGHH